MILPMSAKEEPLLHVHESLVEGLDVLVFVRNEAMLQEAAAHMLSDDSRTRGNQPINQLTNRTDGDMEIY